MATRRDPDPVKILVAVLWANEDALRFALDALGRLCGEIDFEGSDWTFDVTGYYDDEMGEGLQRRIVAFECLQDPQILPALKLRANEIEASLSDQRGRRVNLDVGYLDHHKVVLASLKEAGQKVYLSDGVYADLMFRSRRGRYEPFEWTFPDFRDGRYEKHLLEIRRVYMRQLRSSRG